MVKEKLVGQSEVECHNMDFGFWAESSIGIVAGIKRRPTETSQYLAGGVGMSGCERVRDAVGSAGDAG